MSASITAQFAFVKITDITHARYSDGLYKVVHVVEEVGYWMNKFRFNVFPDNMLYTLLEPGTKLSVKVRTVLTKCALQLTNFIFFSKSDTMNVFLVKTFSGSAIL